MAPIPPLRRALYALGTVLLVLGLAEGVLALAGMRPMAAVEDPYVGYSAHLPLFVEDTAPDGTPVMVTAANKLGFFNRQSFRRDKPAGLRRIFCLGGSTTYGHPHDDRVSFCGWLRAFLAEAEPGGWEVINAGGISYASYRVAALMAELARHRPDLFIVYSGHNEFIEERTYGAVRQVPPLVMDANAVLGRSRVFTAIRRAVTPPPAAVLKGEVDERLARSVGPTSYRRDDALQAGVRDHYRFNLARMVTLARAAGAGLVFVTPAANLKDMAPFKSAHAPGLDAARWDAVFAAARAEPDAARRLALLEPLVAADERHAEAQYERGRALLALGRAAEAEAALKRAADEDVVPLRALSDMVEDVRRVARRHDVPLVDFAAMVADWTRAELGHSIPGREWFVDHVHLNVEAYRRLALELLNQLDAQGLLRARPDAASIARVTDAVEAGLSPADHGRAIVTVATVLGWAGRLDEAHRLLEDARALLGDDLDLLLKLGHSAERRGRPDEAEAFYAEAASRHPNAAEPHRRLAERARAKGDGAAWLAHRRAALTAAPESAEDRAALAEALGGQGLWAEAAEHYRWVAERHLDSGLAQFNLAVALQELDDVEGALLHFREAARLEPKRAEPRLGIAAMLARTGRLDEAVDHLREAVRLAPDSAEARDALAAALADLGRR